MSKNSRMKFGGNTATSKLKAKASKGGMSYKDDCCPPMESLVPAGDRPIRLHHKLAGLRT